ncbi:MAG: ABC transporter permease [Oscillospiraceae bacterium]|nr:ABC transporter permease [Oscillospiraceae bacterium]MCL2279181.1 ABC transporter permease [Oscillospiraceae bacterium]
MQGLFENTGNFVRFKLRRERIISTIWIASLVLFSYSLAAGLPEMFDADAKQALVEMLKNPAMIAMMGPIYGADNFTTGAMYSVMLFIWVAMTAATMNIFLVVRHTRADEEAGRTEVVRSLPTGRLAILNSTMITAVIVNAILALLTGLLIASVGEESMPFWASMLYGKAIGLIGLFFAAVTAFFSQLSASSRGATGSSFIAMAAMYFLRAIGDLESEVISLISPLGLIQRSQFFVENNIWPSIVLLSLTVVVTAAAYKLNSVRDIGQGFIAARHGKPHGGRLMRSPMGFSFRMTRNTIIAWLIILFVLGASYASILPDIDAFVAESPFYQAVIGVNDDFPTLEMFISTINIFGAIFATVPLLIIALRPIAEEREGRAEAIFAAPVPRESYLCSYAIPAFLSSIVFMFANFIGIYSVSYVLLDEPLSFRFLFESNMVFLPALWVLIGLAFLLIGLIPKLTSVIWAYFGFSFFTLFMGRMLDLPEWLGKLSPFGHIPLLPVDDINFTTLSLLTAISIALLLAGLVFYERRDLSQSA